MARMLLVDDEAIVRRSIARLLADEGHTLVFASDVADAEHRLATEQYDLVVADVNMPGESGIELLRRIKRDHPNVAVLMVTGVDDPAIGAEAVELGASAYLVKPFKPTELLVAVCTALKAQLAAKDEGDECICVVDEEADAWGKTADEVISCLTRIRDVAARELPSQANRIDAFCAAIAREMALPASACTDSGLSDSGLSARPRITQDPPERQRAHASGDHEPGRTARHELDRRYRA